MKKMLSLLLALAMVFSLAACGSSSSSSSTPTPETPETTDTTEALPTYTIKAACAYNDDHYMGIGYHAFEEYVETASDGRIQVELYLNGSIVSGDSDSLEYVSSGAVQVGNSDCTMIGSFISDNRWESTSIPYYYGSDLDTVYDILDNSDAWHQLYDELETAGNLVILGSVNGGIAVVGSDVPVNSMSDFAGKKYRTATSDPYLKPVEGWGSSAVPMAFSEIYTSVQNKTINGTFTSMSAIYSQGLVDVMKNLVRVDAFNLLFAFMMNADYFNSMDAEAQQIVLDGGKVLTDTARDAEAEYSNNLDSLLADAGVTVVTPDASWQAELESSLSDYIAERCAVLDQDWLATLNKDLGK